MYKVCSKCKTEYPATTEYFPAYKRCKDGLGSWCRKCKDISGISWRKANKKRCQDNQIRLKYGISLEDYDRMFAKQKGCCAICGKSETAVYKEKIRRLSVDHDHNTGKVRGLLCDACNRGLGNFKENIDTLKMAIDYLLSTLVERI